MGADLIGKYPIHFYIRTDPMATIPTSLPQSGFLTPPQVGLAYNVPLPSATQGRGLTVGIISLGGGFRQSDLALSFADLVTAGLLPAGAVAPTVNVTLIDGATGTYGVSSSADFENTGDIYCVSSMVPGARINIYIGVGRTSLNNCIAQAVADRVDVITISYGYDESLFGDFCASSLAAASAAKIPVLVCTGDYGSAVYRNDYNEYPQYPASSPLTIAVGGTNLTLKSDNSRATETVDSNANDPIVSDYPGWGGGGGISSLFAVPSFQSGLNFTTYNTSTGTGATMPLTNRGTPDISLAMNPYVLYKGGGLAWFGGTSAACPVMAGIMVRLIEATGTRWSSAQWNTFFYSNYNASTFYDIIGGNNATYIADGYSATSRWDPATGLGVPNGIGLYNALLPKPLNKVVVNRVDTTTPTPSPTPQLASLLPTPVVLPDYVPLLTVAKGAIPATRDYNSLLGDLEILMTGQYGYQMKGYTQYAGNPISAQAWKFLYNDVQTCYIHQYGISSPTIASASTSSTIRAQDINNIEATVSTLITNNTWTVATNQLTTTTVNTLYSSSPTWANSFNYSITYNWTTSSQIAYFFNLGGKIQPSFTTAGADAANWSSLINQLNSLYYDHSNYISGNPFNATYSAGSNYLKLSANSTGSQLTISIDFTNTNATNNLQINGALVTTYSNNLTGGISAPVPVPIITSGGSLSPLPIPPFSFSVGGVANREMTLGNNSGYPINVGLSLSGYGGGSLFPTGFRPLANNTSATFTISYTGSTPGIYTGNLNIVSDIGNVSIPTTVLIGTSISITPPNSSLVVTNSVPVFSDLFSISQVGSNEVTYSVSLDGASGFSLVAQDQVTPFSGGNIGPPSDLFCIKFDPNQLGNGTHSTVATVTVGLITKTVIFTVELNVPDLQHYGNWISALADYNAVVGVSYDKIGGNRCITIGIGGTPSIDTNGYVAPDITELSKPISTFQHWVEVYRIPLTRGNATYYSTTDYLLQSGSWGRGRDLVPFIIGPTFGVGDSQGSICTIVDDGTGNLGITLNSLYSPYTSNIGIYYTQADLNYCFNYYDEITNRHTQLEPTLVEGGQTHCFTGFNSVGAVQTTLVPPNIYSSVNDGGGGGE